MFEKLIGIEKMTMHQCEELAKDIGFDNATFILHGPKGSLNCKWLDAYFGMFQMEGVDGFVMSRTFDFVPDIWCTDLMPAPVDTQPSTESLTK